ncbi:hypothetical protein B0I37DRAFT_350799 [Chaetomium sp. MPI-CAGE-AT-0009]|nr:hypothetical protein B0I37DRAFT_350799 [Chaetomium sp. MPI-CAGE-AT-0009]
MSSTTTSAAEFEAHRNILVDLYWDQDKTLQEVMKIMKDVYGLVAGYNFPLLLGDRGKRLTPWSPNTYKHYLVNKWGKRKKTSTEESFAMLEIRRRRRIEENKETEFTRLDRDVDNNNLDRFAKRHNYDMDSSWPLPETRANPSYLGSTASEEEQASVEGPHGSYRAHNLQSGDMPSTWHYDDTWVGPQPSHHTSVPIQLDTNPSPVHLIPHSSQGFPQNNAGPTFPRSPYRHHTELPAHTSNILADGASSWEHNSQPPQPASQSPAFGMDASVPTYPINYSPRIDQRVIAATPFYDASQTHGAAHAPELAFGVLGNTLRHGTVVGNNVQLAGAMLRDGVDSSSAMAFPHTDDDTLGAMDGVDDELGVLDNMIVWPEREARPM